MSEFKAWQNTMHKQFEGNAILRVSSEKLSWSDITLQHYEATAAHRPEIFIEHPTLAVFLNRTAVPFDRRDVHGNFIRQVRRPGMSVLLHPGVVPSIRSLSTIHLLVCGIQRNFLEEVALEAKEGITWKAPEGGSTQVGNESEFLDQPLNRIIELLHFEAKQGGQSGLLYTEHLSNALAYRMASLVRLYGSSRVKPTPTLPRDILRRVVDKIKADVCADHTLASLASESGYSRSHFLRAFAASVGSSPHQYVMKVRLKYARELLISSSLSVAEIATHCGFASDAHLSRTFHSHYGLPPSVFRRTRRHSIGSK
ncbi:MAG: AraC family transcriptional regulator [Edaphobacter sp.]